MRVAIRVLLSLAILMVHIMLTVRTAEGPGFRSRTPTAPVVIVQRDLPDGARIDRGSLAVAHWPVGTIPAGAFTSIDALLGRVTRVPVFKGEAVVPGRLAMEGARPGVEVKITPGKRAMSFRTDDATTLAGIIQPGSRVDLLLVVERDGKSTMAKLFMENKRVLAIGSPPTQWADRRTDRAGVATIEVTPGEGERLALALTQGQIRLVLRRWDDFPSDVSVAPGPVPTLQQSPPPAKKPAPDGPAVVRNAVILRY